MMMITSGGDEPDLRDGKDLRRLALTLQVRSCAQVNQRTRILCLWQWIPKVWLFVLPHASQEYSLPGSITPVVMALLAASFMPKTLGQDIPVLVK